MDFVLYTGEKDEIICYFWGTRRYPSIIYTFYDMYLFPWSSRVPSLILMNQNWIDYNVISIFKKNNNNRFQTIVPFCKLKSALLSNKKNGENWGLFLIAVCKTNEDPLIYSMRGSRGGRGVKTMIENSELLNSYCKITSNRPPWTPWQTKLSLGPPTPFGNISGSAHVFNQHTHDLLSQGLSKDYPNCL